MNDREVTWILVVDERGARLLRGRASGSGNTRFLRLERVAEIENSWMELCETKSSTGPSTSNGDQRRRRAEFLQRYAAELGRWLAEEAREHGILELELFAPLPLALVLRRERPQGFSARIHEHQLDLGRLTPERLETHPAVCALFRSQAG